MSGRDKARRLATIRRLMAKREAARVAEIVALHEILADLGEGV